MRIFADPNARLRVSAAAQSGGLLNPALFYWTVSIVNIPPGFAAVSAATGPLRSRSLRSMRHRQDHACAEATLILFHGNLPSILLHHFGS